MNPPCARCNKTVYVTEKLSCLDKVRERSERVPLSPFRETLRLGMAQVVLPMQRMQSPFDDEDVPGIQKGGLLQNVRDETRGGGKTRWAWHAGARNLINSL